LYNSPAWTLKRRGNLQRNLYLAETKKSATDLQKKIFEKAFKGKTYEKIAEECNFIDSYVKEVGSDLWRILSSKLGKRVSKKKF
jgi:hypothetical protein